MYYHHETRNGRNDGCNVRIDRKCGMALLKVGVAQDSAKYIDNT